jgi:signal transduction histidine kinase
MMVPLPIGGETRGVLGVSSAQPDFFAPDDLRFAGAVARWVGAVAHRVELVQELTKLATRSARRAAAEELVTVLAHDMANHLMPLRARIELIQRRAARDNAADYLRDADGAAASLNALTRLVSGLLDVSRLDQGLFSLRPGPVDVVALAKEVATSLRAPGRMVEYRGPEELVVIADGDRLRQVLENLTANALKHSPAGLGAHRRHGPGARHSPGHARHALRALRAGARLHRAGPGPVPRTADCPRPRGHPGGDVQAG